MRRRTPTRAGQGRAFPRKRSGSARPTDRRTATSGNTPGARNRLTRVAEILILPIGIQFPSRRVRQEPADSARKAYWAMVGNGPLRYFHPFPDFNFSRFTRDTRPIFLTADISRS